MEEYFTKCQVENVGKLSYVCYNCDVEMYESNAIYLHKSIGSGEYKLEGNRYYCGDCIKLSYDLFLSNIN